MGWFCTISLEVSHLDPPPASLPWLDFFRLSVLKKLALRDFPLESGRPESGRFKVFVDAALFSLLVADPYFL